MYSLTHTHTHTHTPISFQGNDLWLAAARGARPAVQRILATVTGVDVNSVENRGKSTALHVASQVGWTDVVKVNIKRLTFKN